MLFNQLINGFTDAGTINPDVLHVIATQHADNEIGLLFELHPAYAKRLDGAELATGDHRHGID